MSPTNAKEKAMKTDYHTDTSRIMSDHVKHYLPESSLKANIVRAVNNFEALLLDAKINAQWFEDNGYPTEAANIRRLIAKAESTPEGK